MKIKPWENKVQVEIDEPKVGGMDLGSMTTAIECGKVVAVGEYVTSLKVGDKIFFKSWAVDIIFHEGIRYYFIDIETKGICAIVK